MLRKGVLTALAERSPRRTSRFGFNLMTTQRTAEVPRFRIFTCVQHGSSFLGRQCARSLLDQVTLRKCALVMIACSALPHNPLFKYWTVSADILSTFCENHLETCLKLPWHLKRFDSIHHQSNVQKLIKRFNYICVTLEMDPHQNCNHNSFINCP